jgi:hypothetical protein
MKKIILLLGLSIAALTASATTVAPWDVATQPVRTNWVANPFFTWINITDLHNGTFQLDWSTSMYVDYCQSGDVMVHQYVKFVYGFPRQTYWVWQYTTYSVSIPANRQNGTVIYTLQPGEAVDGTYQTGDIQPWPCS